MSHFFAYLSRLRYIQRWGLMRNTRAENTQEHSLQVAMIAHGLALIRNRYYGGRVNPEHVLAMAVFHDASEVITGDLPTPIKYYSPQIKRAYQEIEEMASQKLLTMLPMELQTDYQPLLVQKDDETHRLVKAADTLSAYLKCVEELKTGNREFEKAFMVLKRKVNALNMPEVTYFLEHFAPSFDLTLDELNEQ